MAGGDGRWDGVKYSRQIPRSTQRSNKEELCTRYITALILCKYRVELSQDFVREMAPGLAVVGLMCGFAGVAGGHRDATLRCLAPHHKISLGSD